uniref:Bromo domain-containing protein n=1 Tax=Daphnia galeata TaxID=27404 RepID=A0A8J2W4V6_9CRUS|nr:unnamed protein product [Daphnia galeata]
MASPDKISSQQKLKMKMVSIDTWSVREQLCLASSVLRSGDQNWVSVSRSLKSFAEPNRPQDWLSPRNCALQYNSLLEKTGAHKRKRGERHPSSGSTDSQQGETAGEIILRQLTQDRIEELQQLLETSRKDYQKLKKELDLVQDGKLDDRLPEICKRIDEENEKKLSEQKSHLKWLQEREFKQQELKQVQQQMLRSPAKTSSISEVVDGEMATGSPSITDQLNIDVSSEEAREITTATPASEAKPTSTGGSLTPLAPAATPSSPLLTSLLRSPTATASGPPSATKGFTTPPSKPFTLTSPSSMSPGLKNLVSTAIGEETSPAKVTSSSPGTRVAAPTLTHLLELPLNSPGKPLPDLTVTEETEVSAVSSPIKNELQIKKQESEAEELAEVPPVLEKTEQVVEVEPMETTDVIVSQEEVESSTKEPEETKPEMEKEVPTNGLSVEACESPVKSEADAVVVNAEDVVELTGKDEQPEDTVTFDSEVEVSHTEEVEKMVEDVAVEVTTTLKTETVEEEEIVNEEEEKTIEEVNEESSDEKCEEKEQKTIETESVVKLETGTPKTTRRTQRGSRKKDLVSETEVTPVSEEKSKSAEPGPTTRRSSGRKGTQSDEQEAEITSLPPPLYVPSTSPAPSSGIDSTPNSPTSSVSTVAEDDRDYRTWKKSILLVWREISSHKNASLFAKPISEESVPGYRSLVMRPMDLSTIKKNIESGAIRSTVEFQRDISLMFFNSIVYNPTYHEVNRLAKEMYTESTTIIQEFVNAQLLAAHNMESLRPVRRETRDLARRTESLSSHEETPVKLEEGKTRAAKRASAAAQVDDNTAAKTKRRSRLHND